MAVQLHAVEWVIEKVRTHPCDSKMRLAKDGTFSTDAKQIRRFANYHKAMSVSNTLQNSTRVVEF